MSDQISELIAAENKRQRSTLNLIASENYPSPAVLEALGSVLQNKYAEGYPGKRYYAGNAITDQVETLAIEQALAAFDSTGEYGVNVQVLSGSPANTMVYLAALEPGDTIMSLDLAGGGHLSHMHGTSAYRKFYQSVNYDVVATELGFEVDFDDFAAKLKAHRPKLVIIGFSAYPARYQFEAMTKLAHDHGALVLADIAHIAGLVAAGYHDSPFKPGDAGADYVTMTTHKTLRGPRGAMVFAKHDLMPALNKTVFPGTSGGPHLHQIAAVAQSLLEVNGKEDYPDGRSFGDYIGDVLTNCLALEIGLAKGGLEIVTKTATHLTLVKLPDEVDSKQVQDQLETLGIITNRNQIPRDIKSPMRPSGLRLGTAALTSQGLTADNATAIGKLIAQIVFFKQNSDDVAAVSEHVRQLNWPY